MIVVVVQVRCSVGLSLLWDLVLDNESKCLEGLNIMLTVATSISNPCDLTLLTLFITWLILCTNFVSCAAKDTNTPFTFKDLISELYC